MVSKAIGYGMPYGDFVQMTKITIREGQHPFVALDYHFEGTGNIPKLTGPSGLAELFVIVDYRACEDVLIFPTETDMASWYRHGDPIDRASARAYNNTGRHKTTYLDIPHADYHVFMDRNGVAVNPRQSNRNDPALIPGVPLVMRKWLLRYGVFDLAGIAKLRPMLSEWGMA